MQRVIYWITDRINDSCTEIFLDYDISDANYTDRQVLGERNVSRTKRACNFRNWHEHRRFSLALPRVQPELISPLNRSALMLATRH